MKKISVKELVEFRRKSDRSKKTFVAQLKSPKISEPKEGGGDYWVTGISAVCNAFKKDDVGLIDEKVDELRQKHNETPHGTVKNMYQRNISILEKYKTLDLKKVRPTGKPLFLKKSSGNPILTIKGLPIEAKPSHIFTFRKKDEEQIGAIWFVAKKDGYRIDEIAMFCDMLYRFLKVNYSKKYTLNTQYCVAIDMLSGEVISYADIESGSLSAVLNSTLDEIAKLM